MSEEKAMLSFLLNQFTMHSPQLVVWETKWI